VTPAIYLVLNGMMTLAAVSPRPLVSGYALLSILAGVPFYYLWRWGAMRETVGNRRAD
jgi:hypothetical protein